MCKRKNVLEGVSTDHLAQLGLFVEVIFGLVTRSKAQSVGLALLLLSRGGSIRLLIMRLRRGRATTSSAVLVVVPVVLMTTLVVIETWALLEVVIVATVGSSSAMIPAVVAPVLTVLLKSCTVLMRRSGHRWRGGRRIALVRSRRVRRGRLVRVVRLRWIASAHWSNGITRPAVVKTHPQGRTHRLGLRLGVVPSSTSSSAKLLGRSLVLRRVGRRWRTPLLGRTTWLLLWRVRLTVRLLGGDTIRWLLWLLAVGRLLLLCVVVLSIVGMIVLRRQSRLGGVRSLMRVLRLTVVGPRLLVLWVADWTRLWVLGRRVLTRVLRTIRLLCLVLRRLLGVAVGGQGLVVCPST